MQTFEVQHNFQEELSTLIARWGVDMQELMCIEEMSELTKELIKKKRGRDNTSELIEEIADVLITVLQMAELNGYYKVMEVVNKKIVRAMDKVKSQL